MIGWIRCRATFPKPTVALNFGLSRSKFDNGYPPQPREPNAENADAIYCISTWEKSVLRIPRIYVASKHKYRKSLLTQFRKRSNVPQILVAAGVAGVPEYGREEDEGFCKPTFPVPIRDWGVSWALPRGSAAEPQLENLGYCLIQTLRFGAYLLDFMTARAPVHTLNLKTLIVAIYH